MRETHRLLLGFVLLSSLAGLGMGVARVVTSLYAVDLKASSFEMGLISGAQSIGILFMSLPVSLLMHRHGPAKLFALGSFFAGLAYALVPLLRSPAFLIACMAFISFCLPLRFISLNTVFMQQVSTLGVARAGWFRAVHMTGFFLLGPVLAVALVETLQFGGAFVAIALSFLLTVLIARLAIGSYRSNDGQHGGLSWKEMARQIALLKHDKPLGRTSVFEFINHAVTNYFGFFIVVIAIQSYQFSEARAAALVTAHGAVFVGSLFYIGLVLRWLGTRRFYLASFAVLAAALLALGVPGQATWLWAGSLLLAVGLAMLHIVNFSEYAQAGHRVGMGRVSGLTSLVGPAGGLLGSLLGGSLGALWGLQALFLPMAGLFGLLGWVAWQMQAELAEPPSFSVTAAAVEES